MRAILIVVAGVCLLAGCTTASSSTSSASIQVVAAEDFWGSIAAQLGGSHVTVTNIVNSPEVDPHDFEPTPDDARKIAGAQYVIANGVGYDPWMDQLVAANPSGNRTVLDVGKLTGHSVGDNPHRWYFPNDVHAVIAQITADYQRIDPAHASDYATLRQSFETNALHDYDSLIAQIHMQFAGTQVGASESIFVGLAQATGLNLVTPASFLDAISEGQEPTPQDVSTVDQQVTSGAVKVLVYNSQNTTPDVQRIIDEAQSLHIPVTTITETLTPATSTFQAWQATQLRDLSAALVTATRR